MSEWEGELPRPQEAVGECAVAKASQQNYLWCLIVWSLITFAGFFQEPPQMSEGNGSRQRCGRC